MYKCVGTYYVTGIGIAPIRGNVRIRVAVPRGSGDTDYGSVLADSLTIIYAYAISDWIDGDAPI